MKCQLTLLLFLILTSSIKSDTDEQVLSNGLGIEEQMDKVRFSQEKLANVINHIDKLIVPIGEILNQHQHIPSVKNQRIIIHRHRFSQSSHKQQVNAILNSLIQFHQDIRIVQSKSQKIFSQLTDSILSFKTLNTESNDINKDEINKYFTQYIKEEQLMTQELSEIFPKIKSILQTMLNTYSNDIKNLESKFSFLNDEIRYEIKTYFLTLLRRIKTYNSVYTNEVNAIGRMRNFINDARNQILLIPFKNDKPNKRTIKIYDAFKKKLNNLTRYYEFGERKQMKFWLDGSDFSYSYYPVTTVNKALLRFDTILSQ